MKKPALVFMAMLTIAATSACDRQAEPPRPEQTSGSEASALDRSHKGSEMPDFLLKDQTGKELRLASLKGKPLLINLWATWCAPCVAELPALDRLAGERTDRLKVLTVSQDMQKLETVAPFLKARGATRLEPWLDPEGELSVQYGAQLLPTSIYYDAQGREVWRFSGPRDWNDAETAALLDEVG